MDERLFGLVPLLARVESRKESFQTADATSKLDPRLALADRRFSRSLRLAPLILQYIIIYSRPLSTGVARLRRGIASISATVGTSGSHLLLRHLLDPPGLSRRGTRDSITIPTLRRE